MLLDILFTASFFILLIFHLSYRARVLKLLKQERKARDEEAKTAVMAAHWCGRHTIAQHQLIAERTRVIYLKRLTARFARQYLKPESDSSGDDVVQFLTDEDKSCALAILYESNKKAEHSQQLGRFFRAEQFGRN